MYAVVMILGYDVTQPWMWSTDVTKRVASICHRLLPRKIQAIRFSETTI